MNLQNARCNDKNKNTATNLKDKEVAAKARNLATPKQCINFFFLTLFVYYGHPARLDRWQ
jgi:hypothetical protein